MFRSVLLHAASGIAMVFALTPSAPASYDPAAVLRRSAEVMGADKLKTLQYTTSGTGGLFGQSFLPEQPWPRLIFEGITRSINYETGSMREENARTRGQPRDEGFLPVGAPQRNSWLVSGKFAWNQAGQNANPAPVALIDRTHELWITPQGIVKAALKNAATLDFDGATAVVSFTEPELFKAKVHINKDYQVEKVESRISNAVLGDIDVVTTYSDYRNFDGVAFPTRIAQWSAGRLVADLKVSDVKPNVPVDITVPDNVRTATERVTTDKVAEGVWFIAGGSHHSVAIEMNDHMILVESPLGDVRALPVIEAVKKLSAKPLRYVVNSHAHFDHAGGVRAAASAGATIVTDAANAAYFAKALANPSTITPDALTRSKVKGKVLGVKGKLVWSDGSRTVEVHHLKQTPHVDAMVIVYLPKEKLLIEADAFTPPPPGTAPPAVARGTHVNLVEQIEGLKLSVEQILPLHGRVVPVGDLYNMALRKR